MGTVGPPAFTCVCNSLCAFGGLLACARVCVRVFPCADWAFQAFTSGWAREGVDVEHGDGDGAMERRLEFCEDGFWLITPRGGGFPFYGVRFPQRCCWLFLVSLRGRFACVPEISTALLLFFFFVSLRNSFLCERGVRPAGPSLSCCMYVVLTALRHRWLSFCLFAELFLRKRVLCKRILRPRLLRV